MATVSKKAVADAANYLIQASNYAYLLREITQIIDEWDTHPMVYAGHLTCLNALIDIGLDNRRAFEAVVELINSRRALMPAMKRTDYQRNLMRDRRKRIAAAVELYELQNGEMSDDAKKRYIKDITARWAAAKREFIKSKGYLNWKAKNEVSREFWDGIDNRLDINLRAAHKKPSH